MAQRTGWDRVERNQPSVHVGIVAPIGQQAIGLNGLAAENAQRGGHDGDIKAARTRHGTINSSSANDAPAAHSLSAMTSLDCSAHVHGRAPATVVSGNVTERYQV